MPAAVEAGGADITSLTRERRERRKEMRMTYRVHVRVMPRAGLLDPQGQAVEHALSALGFAETPPVHVGRAIEIEVDASRATRPRPGRA